MDPTTRRELRQVRAILLTAGIATGLLTVTAFHQSQKTRFTEIDAERINVVEKDGKLRLTISNAARLPDPIIGGKSYPLRSGTGAGSAGMIFFNDDGNESGGLAYAGRQTATGYRANGHLTFDQFDQDETISFTYSDVDGRARAGLAIADRSEMPIKIADPAGRTRLRLTVDSAGTPRMEFLDEAGRTVRRYPTGNQGPTLIAR